VAVAFIGADETAAFKGTDRFPMQSVYKLPIGMTVLHQVDQGKLKLDQKVKVSPAEYVRRGQHSPIRDQHPRGVELSLGEILRLAVSESDGTASDVLMRVAGGPAVIQSYLKDLGIEGIRVVNTEKEIGSGRDVQYQNWATPESAVALLKIIAAGRSFSPENQTLLLKLMTDTPTGLRRIKGMLPPGTVVAHKTGTGGMVDGISRATNDIGLVTLPDGQQLAIAVFVSDTRLATSASEDVIARLSRAAWDCWAKR
jgi:beta-lactamase class A